jgi:multicomponent Na+:H+ antiporter subunit F
MAALAVIALALLLSLYRLVMGPSIADRVIALDSMTVISTSLIVLVAIMAARVIYLDVAMIYAILSFVGVIAVARFLEGGF